MNKYIEPDTEECLTATEQTSCTPDTLGLEEVCPTAKYLESFFKTLTWKLKKQTIVRYSYATKSIQF